MLSHKTYAEIALITQQVLQQIPGADVIDRVTVIRGYAQLLAIYPTRKEYEVKLATALLDLSSIASRFKAVELSRNLEALVTAINTECML